MTGPRDTATTPEVRPAADPDARGLLAELVAARVVPADAADAVFEEFRRAGTGVDAEALAGHLVHAGLATAFQAGQALAGRAAALLAGPYLLAEPVGSGSLGTVYRAAHFETGERHAVKLLPLRSLWNVVRAKRQVEAFAAMPPHPAIVPFVDVGTAGGSHYLVWPFAEGETFESLVRRAGPLPPAQAVRFASEILAGLAACHAAGVAHGLVKPSNLLLGPDRRARLLDLGIGAILSENIADGESMMDTISTANVAMNMMDCAPPETLADPTARTPAGDLYALGCTLYYLLTGVYPFPDGNAVDKMIAHQAEEPLPAAARNPLVPEGLSHLVEHLMRKAPGDRPADLALLASALDEAVPAAAGLTAADLPAPFSDTAAQASARWKQPSNFGPGQLGRPSGAGSSPLLPYAPYAPGSPAGAEDAETVSFAMGEPVETPRQSGSVKLAAARPEATPPPAAAPAPPSMVRQIVLQGRPAAAPATPVTPARRDAAPPAGAGLPPSSVYWTAPADGAGRRDRAPVRVPPPPPRLARGFWGRLADLLPWARPRDVVQFSVFGPAHLSPGRTYQYHVYSHPPDSFSSVCTISRAFTADADLVATGYAAGLIPRGATVGLHLAVANAGVARSLVTFAWAGQSKPWKFDVHVPWESPAGVVAAVLSVGLDQVQAGRLPFELVVLPRTG